MRLPTLPVLLSGLSLLLAMPDAPAQSTPAHENGSWTLVRMDGQPAPAHTQGKPIYVEFDAGKKTVSGFAGVNRFNGTYHLENHQLVTRKMVTTRMVGPLSKQERRFLDILQGGPDVHIEGQTLQLIDKEILAEFHKAPRIELKPVDP